MSNPNEFPADINKFLDDIETNVHAEIDLKAREQQAELDEYEAEFDVFRQQVFNALTPVFDNEVREIRSRAVGIGYENLGYNLILASGTYYELTGERNHGLDRLADIMRGADSIAEALQYGDKQTVLEVIDVLHDLSPEEKTALLKIANHLVDDETDIFDLDIQMKAVLKNDKNSQEQKELQDLSRKICGLLDERFASLCSLDDPIYRDMRTFVSVALTFNFDASNEFDKFSKKLCISVEKTRKAIDEVKAKLSI